MTQPRDQQSQHHPTVTEHPEQRRQEETGHEDASEAEEVGRPPSGTKDPKKDRKDRNKSEHAA